MNIPEIQGLVDIAREAGDAVMEYYEHSGGIDWKEDRSPLTKADLAAESVIQDGLRERYEFPVLSEEAVPPYEERRDWETFWLVDPLDGTKEFIERNGEFTINIALISSGKPLAGVVYAPAIGELYHARAGHGAYRVKNGAATRISGPAGPCGLIVTASRKHRSPLDDEFLRLNGVTETIPMGSSLKFCAVASGRATLYPRLEGSMEWDIGAGHIIATEAGARITDLHTRREPEYNKRNPRNNYFLVCAPGLGTTGLRIPPGARVLQSV